MDTIRYKDKIEQEEEEDQTRTDEYTKKWNSRYTNLIDSHTKTTKEWRRTQEEEYTKKKEEERKRRLEYE